MAKSSLIRISVASVLLVSIATVVTFAEELVDPIVSYRLPGCAEMACYSLLQLSGTDVQLTEVTERFRQRVPDFNPNRISIHQLRNITSSFGVETDAIRVSPQKLSDLPLPCIIYFRPRRWRHDESEMTGHFLTVAHVNEETVRAFDWDSVTPDPVLTLPMDFIKDRWDGEVIILRRYSIVNRALLVVILIFTTVAAARRLRKKQFASPLVSLLLYGAIVFSSTAGCGQQNIAGTTESMPIRFTAPTVNLGVVRGPGRLEVKFPFTVWDNGPAQIVQVSKSCNCTAINEDLIDQELEPGSSHEFIVGLIPTGTPARSEVRTIQVVTDPPANPPIHIAIIYRLLGQPVISVEELTANGDIGQVIEADFEITYHRAKSDRPITLLNSKCDWGDFTPVDIKHVTEEFELQSDALGKIVTDRTKIHLRHNPSPVCGDFRSLLTLRFDDQSSKDLAAVVRIEHPFRLLVKRGYCGRCAAGERWAISIPYRWDRKGGTVDRIECSVPDSSAELTPTAILMTGMAPKTAGRFEGDLKISFRETALPPLTVPMSGLVVDE